ncbi:MAG: SWIM zinc finger family protein [Bacillus sp. (in: firmicutes)]
MATIDEYTAEMLDQAARDLKGLLRPEVEEHVKLVQKGLMIYRQGLVHQLRFDGDHAYGSVQDVTPVYVRLDLDDLAGSACSCPSTTFCRHRLAVFFQSLAQAGSVAHWVEEWRRPIAAKNVAVLSGLKTARDLLKSSKRPEANFEGWLETFSQSFESIMYGQGKPNPYVVSDLFAVYWRRTQVDAPVEQEWRYLYELIAGVKSFLLLGELSREFGHTSYMVDRYYRHLFQNLLEDAEKAMKSLAVSTMPFAFDDFIEKIKNEARQLLSVNKVVEYEGVHLYRQLWSGLLKKSEWRNEERQWLYQAFEQNEDDFALNIALLHQQVLARNDEQALAQLDELSVRIMPYMIFWLESMNAEKDWKRIAPFVELFVGRLHEYLKLLDDYEAGTDFTGMALDLIRPFCEASGRSDMLERTLLVCLPYSYRVYDSFLYREGAFAKWVELQVLIGLELEYLDSERLKEIGKRDPAALLPLYHQAIQSSIDLKNRVGYRAAVRLLKKVRTFYKKLDRLDEWERFFELLQVQTRRLRAFQEECIRGKLLNA